MSYDVVVVGAGVMGSATARALAARGARVALLEQFHTGHVRGSSHGRGRIFRFSYPDPMYVGMASLYIGIAVATGVMWALATLLVVLAVIRFHVIAREEAYLTAKFGDAYRDYQSRVRRWI